MQSELLPPPPAENAGGGGGGAAGATQRQVSAWRAEQAELERACRARGLVTARELAESWRVSTQTVYARVKLGMPVAALGHRGAQFFDRAPCEAWARKNILRDQHGGRRPGSGRKPAPVVPGAVIDPTRPRPRGRPRKPTPAPLIAEAEANARAREAREEERGTGGGSGSGDGDFGAESMDPGLLDRKLRQLDLQNRMRELDLQERLGQMADLQQVMAGVRRLCTSLRTGLESLPSQVFPDLLVALSLRPDAEGLIVEVLGRHVERLIQAMENDPLGLSAPWANANPPTPAAPLKDAA